MKLKELKTQISLGEDSRRQFKRDVTNADSLTAEMAAFANSEGGTIFLGVADDGSLPGLSRADVLRLNQMIGNAASKHVRSPLTVQTENIGVGRTDYLLCVQVGPMPKPLPVSVLEAKKESEDPLKGMHQAKGYADWQT